MRRAERLWRLGACLAVAAAATAVALGCSDPEEEVFDQPGNLVIVTVDTATVQHREPSLHPNGSTVIFSTDWPFDPAVDEDKTARDIAVIELPETLVPHNGGNFTGSPTTVPDARFRKVVFPLVESDAPGGELVQFDPNLRSKSQPVWDPVRTDRFALVINNPSNVDRIYICQVDLAPVDQATVLGAEFVGNPQGQAHFFNDPAYSPDGRWLLFSRYLYRQGVGGEPDQVEPQALYVLELDGNGDPLGAPIQLTSGSSLEGGGSWSPSGTRIAFHSTRGFGEGEGAAREVYVMDFDPNAPGAVMDLNVQRLTFATASSPSTLLDESWEPTWSPSGASIAFTSSRRNPGVSLRDRSIWIMNADGSDQRALVSTRSDDINPSYGNTASRIVFASENHPLEAFRDQRSDIWLLRDL